MIVSVLPVFKSLFDGTLTWRAFILPLVLTVVAALVHVQQGRAVVPRLRSGDERGA
jgi:hypothetical protein